MDVIGYAGSTGLLGFDYGRNKIIVHDVAKHLTSLGFKLTRTKFTELSEYPDRAEKQYHRTEHLHLIESDLF